MSRFWVISSILYVVLAGLLFFGLLSARNRMARSAELEARATQQAWDAWREHVKEESLQPGPVERSIPRSDEPPTVRLLRDYFWVSVLGVVTITSALFWSLAFLLRGAVAGPEFPIELKDE